VIDNVGADCLMYASDYPHGDMSWTRVPETQAMPNLTDAEKATLLGGAAARFYKLPLAKPAADGQPTGAGARV
jgi:predicted TIM-barrel fold metal-dependent hydrolase